MLTSKLETALSSRAPFLTETDTDAFRLLNGKIDGVPGMTADKFANVVILQTLQGKSQPTPDAVQTAAEWYGERLGIQTVYVKQLPQDRSGTDATCNNAETTQECRLIWGSSEATEVMVREYGINYLVQPCEGFLTGLFLDQRENRRLIGELAPGRDVLNLFAYTCSFSVAAAAAGATSTASVDISRKSLEWGKRNFAANSMTLDDQLFFCSDVFRFFKRALRQNRRYDVIVVDPPTFARQKRPARDFKVVRDMASVIQGALELLNDDGYMLVSTNHHQSSVSWLRDQIKEAADQRRYKFITTPDTPPDFKGSPDASKTVWCHFPKSEPRP